MLSDKVKRRAYDNAMAKAGALQKRSQAAVEKLIHTIDLVSRLFIISRLPYSCWSALRVMCVYRSHACCVYSVC